MAADVLSQAGVAVTLFEAKPSAGRKFLMAGKSGLNLTKAEPLDAFIAHYTDAAAPMSQMLDAFGPEMVQSWAGELGQEVFTGSTGRVFPVAMKASPLLRAWMARLAAQGVGLRTRMRWQGWAQDSLVFDTPRGAEQVRADATVLALGGASWGTAWVRWPMGRGSGGDGCACRSVSARQFRRRGVVVGPDAASLRHAVERRCVVCRYRGVPRRSRGFGTRSRRGRGLSGSAAPCARACR